MLNDDEMKACYFSRQKTRYARHLATSILNGDLSIEGLSILKNDEIRKELKKINGVGDWTVDVYLMMVLHRNDCFPIGDIALMKSVKEVNQLLPNTTKDEILSLSEKWKPYRRIAAFIFWHSYILKRNIKI